jgi:predicted nucleic acid-binding protein
MKSNCVVVDASIALKWVLDEADSSTALAMLADWTNNGVEILAPALLAYEVTNALYRRVGRGVIPSEDARRGLKRVIFTSLELEFFQDADFSIRAMELAQYFGLPATYDAHYLALAESKGCELWTADERMWNSISGKLPWVRWITDYSTTSSDA